jgi:hypothetical protein
MNSLCVRALVCVCACARARTRDVYLLTTAALNTAVVENMLNEDRPHSKWRYAYHSLGLDIFMFHLPAASKIKTYDIRYEVQRVALSICKYKAL